MKQVELIIFDLDGVIVSTDYYHYLAWKEIANQEKIHFDEKINNQLRGVSRKDSLEIILSNTNKKYSLIEKEQLLELKNKKYLESLNELSKDDLLEGALELIYYLKKKGYKVAIGSASKNAETILKKLTIYEYFDFVSDGNNIQKGKPDPEVFLNVTNFFNISPIKTVVIEDAEAGIDAANKANMISVGIGPASMYDKSKYKINHLSDLLKHL